MQKVNIIKKFVITACIIASVAVISNTVMANTVQETQYVAVETIAENLGYEVYQDNILNCYSFIQWDKNLSVVQTVGEDFWVDTGAIANYYTGNTYIDTETGKLMVPVSMIESAFGVQAEIEKDGTINIL